MCGRSILLQHFLLKKSVKYLQIFEKVSSTLAKECRELWDKDSLLEINEKRIIYKPQKRQKKYMKTSTSKVKKVKYFAFFTFE